MGSGSDCLLTQLFVLGGGAAEPGPAVEGALEGLVNEAPMIGAHDVALFDEPGATFNWAGLDIEPG